MKKSPGSKPGKKPKTQMLSAFELALLAKFTNGNLRSAFDSYLSASEYLETNGAAELALRKRALSKEKIEAFAQLMRSGALNHQDAGTEYEKLVSGLKPALKLYKDKRDDAVKSAIRAVTNRPCNYQTARDFLKKAWVLNPSAYTASERLAKINRASKPWDRWCDVHTRRGQDKEKKTYRYLSIPGELIEAALRLLCRSRGISPTIAKSAWRSAAAVEYAIEHPLPSAEEEERQKQWVEDFHAAATVGRTDDLVQLRNKGKWPKERDIDWLKKARSERTSCRET